MKKVPNKIVIGKGSKKYDRKGIKQELEKYSKGKGIRKGSEKILNPKSDQKGKW